MTITATATQLSNTAAEVIWADTDPPPILGWQVYLAINGGVFQQRSQLPGGTFTFLDDVSALAIVTSDVLVWEVRSLDLPTFGDTPAVTWADLEAPYTYGRVDALATVPRYTTLDAVKDRMSITHGNSDAAITTSIVAAEYAIDVTNGRSFPDTGVNPEWPGVPQAIVNWATDASIAIWKAGDEPHGQGGSDAWLGALDTSQITERVLRQHPLAQGFTVAAGFGVA